MRPLLTHGSTQRLLDLAIAVPGGILSLPLQAVIAGMIRLTMGPPVLFRQIRPGLHGKPFEMVKFRTMRPPRPDKEEDDAIRLTPLGRALRASSLDELPTVWNVLRGDMSMVGPRPLLMHYLAYYTPEQARRHDVRPGITGLAQVSGRNELTWEQRFRLDIQYVDHASLTLDLRILLRTVATVLRRRGISARGSATMPELVPARYRGGDL